MQLPISRPISRTGGKYTEGSDSGTTERQSEWKIGDTILDLYEVKHIHWGGGMGLVYCVWHRGWNMYLAMKSPRPGFFQTETQKENFVRECETWVRLGLHPHVASCFYVRTVAGIPRIFAEYVEGGSLKEWIGTKKLYEGDPEAALERVLDVAIQMAWGLHFGHDQGVIHQDVKPANVLMMPDGTAKISDFGLARARVAAGEITASGKRRTVLVSRGGMTEAYCSPEQSRHESVTHKTDVWSWGISVLEMFAGMVFWKTGVDAPSALERLMREWEEGGASPALRQALTRLLGHCFHEDSAKRPHDLFVISEELMGIYRELTGMEYARQNPGHFELLGDDLNNRGVSFWDLGKAKEAEQAFDQALETNPGHLEASFNRSLIRWRNGNATDAELISVLEEVLHCRFLDWITPYLLGVAHMQRRDAKSAVTMLERALQLGGGVEVAQALQLARHALPESPRPVHEFQGHGDWVKAVALSPDGRLALSGSADKTLRLWETNTKHCLRTFEGHTDWVNTVALSADGRLALSGSGDRTLRLWEAATGKCVRIFEGHTDWVTSAALSADGQRALSGSGDKTLRLWEVDTGECCWISEAGAEWITSVALAADGEWALSASVGREVRLWDLRAGRCVRVFDGHSGRVNSVALSADGRWAISGGHDAVLRVWEVGTGRCLRTCRGHAGSINCVAMIAHGSWALCGDAQGTLRLWELATGRCLRTFEGHTDWINSVALSRDGRWAVTSGVAQSYLWDLGTEPWVSRDGAVPLAVCKLAGGSESTRIAGRFGNLLLRAKSAASAGRHAECLGLVREAQGLPGYKASRQAMDLASLVGRYGVAREPRTLRLLYSVEGHGERVNSVALNRRGQWALSGADDKTMRLWDTAAGRCLRTFEGHTGEVTCVALQPIGHSAISGSKDGTVRLWDSASGCCLQRLGGHGEAVNAVALTADGRWIVSGGCDKTVRLWEAATGRCLREFTGHTRGVVSVAITDDGQWALSSGEDKKVRLWDVASGNCLRVFQEQTALVTSLAPSWDGRWVLTGGADNLLRLWEIASGRRLKTFDEHKDRVTSAALSADKRWVVSASLDQTIRLWEVGSGHSCRTVEGHAGVVTCLALSGDMRWIFSATDDGKLWLRELDWNYDFPEPVDWDDAALSLLEVFLTVHAPVSGDGLTHNGIPVWTDEQFEALIEQLQFCGFGWLQPQGVRRQLADMVANRQDLPRQAT